MNSFLKNIQSKKVFFWPLLWLEALVVTYLNWDATAMTGLIPYYELYARIVASGFASASAPGGFPTFPMWGYGWVILVLRTKVAIVIFQQLLAMLSVWTTLRLIRSEKLVQERVETMLRVVLLLSPGWFALHSVLWPNSIFASLLPISLLLLLRALRTDHGRTQVVLAGLVFGLLLNFRSDFLLLPPGLALLLVWIGGFSRGVFRRAAIWLAAVYVMLIPWATYSRAATGHTLLTSTNGGHVFFIGLGNLPGNKWGIQADDGDSVMHRVLEKKFGKPVPASVSYKADGVLKHEFLERIEEDPAEYLRKMGYTARSMVTKGAYSGEVYETKSCKPNCWQHLDDRGPRIIAELPEMLSSEPTVAIRTAFYLGSEVITRLFVLLSYLVLPFTLFIGFRRRDLLAGMLVLTIVYQSLLSLAGYFMPAYTSMLFLILALNLAVGAVWLFKRGPLGPGRLDDDRDSRSSYPRLDCPSQCPPNPAGTVRQAVLPD